MSSNLGTESQGSSRYLDRHLSRSSDAPPTGVLCDSLSTITEQGDNQARGKVPGTVYADIYQSLFAASSVPRVLSQSSRLATPEKLLWELQRYLRGSFASGWWSYDSSQNLINTHGQCRAEDVYVYRFYDFFRIATKLLSQKAYPEGRIALSKGMDLVPSMLQNESPRLLESLFSTLILLQRRGYSDICSMTLSYISQMTYTLIPPTEPLHQVLICFTSSELGAEDALLAAWECVSDAFIHELGKLSPAAVMCHNNRVRVAYGQKDPARVERTLQALLKEAEQTLEQYNLALLATSLQLIHSLAAQGKFDTAGVLAENLLETSRNAGEFQLDYEAKALEAMANIRSAVGASCDAERILRKAIQIYAQLRDADDPVLMNLKLRLELWTSESAEPKPAIGGS